MGRGQIDWTKLASLEEGEAIVRLAIAYNDLYLMETLDRTYKRVGYGDEFVFGVALYKMRIMLAICEEIRLLVKELINKYESKITKIIDTSAKESWKKLESLSKMNLMALARSKGLYHYDGKYGFADWVKAAIPKVGSQNEDCPDSVGYEEGIRFVFADRILNEVFKTSIWEESGGTKDGDVNDKIYKESVALVEATMNVLQAIVEHYLKELTDISRARTNELNISMLNAELGIVAKTLSVGDYIRTKGR